MSPQDKLIYFLATGFHSSKPDNLLSKIIPVSKFPGTVGSAAFLLLFLLCRFLFPQPLSLAVSVAFSTLFTLFSVFVTDKALKLEVFSNNKDPKEIVIDEWAGMSFALIFVTSEGMSFISVSTLAFLAFILFRFFDILKPPPISNIEKLPGAWGVVLDDVVAGIISLLVCFVGIMLLVISGGR